MTISYSEVVRIVEFGPFEVHHPKNAEPLKFRVEIAARRNSKEFFARIYRRETFRINPTFPLSKSNRRARQFVDVEILVSDDFIAIDEVRGKSANEVLKKVENILKQMFGRVRSTI